MEKAPLSALRATRPEWVRVGLAEKSRSAVALLLFSVSQ